MKLLFALALFAFFVALVDAGASCALGRAGCVASCMGQVSYVYFQLLSRGAVRAIARAAVGSGRPASAPDVAQEPPVGQT